MWRVREHEEVQERQRVADGDGGAHGHRKRQALVTTDAVEPVR